MDHKFLKKATCHIAFTFVILSLVSIGMLSTSRNASAATVQSHVVKVVPMYFRCDTGTKAFKKYTVAHHLCPSASSISPQNTVYGICGDSYIYSEVSTGGTGVVTLVFGAQSYDGPIIGGSALVTVTGAHQPYAFPVSANNGIFAWVRSDTIFLDGGSYSAELTGGAEVLIAGILPTTCYFENPSTSFSV